MPSLKQAQIPPANLKDMINLSSAAPSPAQPQMPRPESIEGRTGLNSLSIGPSPSLLTTAYDTIRQWIRPGAPQFRIAPLPIKANQQSGALAQSTVTQSKSSGNTGTVTSVGLSMPNIFTMPGENGVPPPRRFTFSVEPRSSTWLGVLESTHGAG